MISIQILVKIRKMIYRQLSASLLFLLSFAVLVLGGYQCATQNIGAPGRTTIPIQPGGENGAYGQGESGFYDPGPAHSPRSEDRPSRRNSLPDDPGDKCARSQYRDLSKRYGEISSFKFDISSLEDYRMGVRQNFDLRCPRMYLSMSRYAKSKKTYKGALAISFEDGRSIKVQKYTSGWTENENKYNKWLGSSWKPDKNDKVNRSFYAIFENNDNAIILRLEDIRVVDVRDGETAYWGAGELYYKMFRIYSGDTGDVCYSKGAYVSHAPSRPPKRARCWLLGIGPFSCRPNGVLPLKAAVTNIDITKSLKCYNRLGEFFGLDIERAFNVGDATQI